jgi:undecaprenyl-diphosphatase
MGDIIEAIVLGVIQGLTEFLPVSSSGHLEIGKVILQDDSLDEQSMLMTVSLHAATALSTIVIFWKDIWEIITKSINKSGVEQRSFVAKIVLSMIPAAFIGVFFDELIESFFSRNLLLVGSMLVVTGLILFVADRAKNTTKSVGFKEALIIGVAQAIAILPGISRSGATISTAVLLGIDREKSARFSFLMVVPLIFGKMAKDLLDGSFESYGDSFLPLGIGFVCAFLTGLVACTWMISIVKRSQLKYFSYYCFVVAVIAIIYSLR